LISGSARISASPKLSPIVLFSAGLKLYAQQLAGAAFWNSR
jgi:hypothetical protein